MPRTPQPVNPAASPWHLLGATMRHWRDDVRQLSQRDIAGVVHVDHTMISAWERATSRPDISSVRAIDEALGTDGQITALHIFIAELDRLRRSKTDINPPVREEDDVERRALLQILTVLGAGAGVPASAVDALHAGLRQITGHASENGADDWEQTAWDYAQGVWTEPPGSRVADLAGDIRALDQVLARTQAPAEHATLLRVYAQLTFMALDLADSSGARACWRSWRVARSVADASGDRELSVWVRAREASESFYMRRLGPPTDTLLDEAVHLADGRPCLGLVEALKTRGRILAAQGRADLARGVPAGEGGRAGEHRSHPGMGDGPGSRGDRRARPRPRHHGRPPRHGRPAQTRGRDPERPSRQGPRPVRRPRPPCLDGGRPALSTRRKARGGPSATEEHANAPRRCHDQSTNHVFMPSIPES